MSNKITDVDILQESKDCFLDYATEVLTDRAIPSAIDGLLRVHREILWTMEEVLKMNQSSDYKKCMAIIGTTLATSYFHGDSSCYGALCKLSLPFLMRYPLIDGGGSLGTQESNDMQAAPRYTNARPSKYADMLFLDFNKNVVDLKPTYNNEYEEPTVLPALFPNALCNGRQAIGVSMAHNSLPHNLTEVCEAIIAYVKNRNISIKEIMEYIKGPDFPTGGTVINSRDILPAFEEGHSLTSLKVRGDYIIQKNDNKKDSNYGRDQIIFTSIPYRTTRSEIRGKINKNINEISLYIDDFDDESSTGESRLVFTVKKGVDPKKAVEVLFRTTSLQTTLSYNMNFIVNGSPKLCSIKTLIEEYVRHQLEVLIRTATFDKKKAEKRLHIILGLLIALDRIEEVLKDIRSSENKQMALEKLISNYSLTEIQAEAILSMKLQQLTKMDKDKLLLEKEEKEKIIFYCQNIINDGDFRDTLLIEKIEAMKKKYGDERRTKIEDIVLETPKKEKKILPSTPVNISLNEKAGTIKVTKGRDSTLKTTLNSTLILFSERGMAYKVPVCKITEKAQAISELTKIVERDRILYITDFNEKGNVYQTTRAGMVKITSIEDFLTNRNVQSIKLKDDDFVIEAKCGEYKFLYQETTEKKLTFRVDDIKPTGRVGLGVKGIKINDSYVIKASFTNDEPEVLGKRNQVGK